MHHATHVGAKRHETARPPVGSLRYPAPKCRPASLQKKGKKKTTVHLDSLLSHREWQNKTTSHGESNHPVVLLSALPSASLSVCWIGFVLLLYQDVVRLNRWGERFINGGDWRSAFIPAGSSLGKSLLQEEAVCQGNYRSSPESLYRGNTTPWRTKRALCACSGDRRPGDAVGAEDASRWRELMISIEVPVSTWHNLSFLLLLLLFAGDAGEKYQH